MLEAVLPTLLVGKHLAIEQRIEEIRVSIIPF